MIHIVDIFGFDDKPAYKNYRAINNELKKHSKYLAKKPMLIAANKTDLTDSDKDLKTLKKHIKNKRIFPISAATGEGIEKLLSKVVTELLHAKDEEVLHREPVKEYFYEPEYSIQKEEDVFIITGPKIEDLVEMTNFDQEESLLRFQSLLKKMGIEKALEEKGISEGDLVRIRNFEFTFEK